MTNTPSQDTNTPETPSVELETPVSETQNQPTDTASEGLPPASEVVEEIDSNFFANVNAEYSRLAEEGSLTAETMQEILSRNEQTWFKTFVDAILNPFDAFEHIGLRTWDYIKNNVIAKITAVMAPILMLKDQIFELVDNPFDRVSQIAESITQLPGLSGLNFDTPEALQRALVMVGNLGVNPGVIISVATLHQYLRNNPQVSQTASESDMQSRDWWNNVFTQAGITENQNELFALVTNSQTVTDVILIQPETVQRANSATPDTPNTPVESVSEAPEGMITLNDFAEARINSLVSLTEKVRDVAVDTINQDRVLSYVAIGGLLSFASGPIFNVLNSTTRFTAGSMSTLANKCASLSGIAFRFGLNHPLLSFGGLMAGSSAVAMYLEHKQRTSIGDTVYIPSSPEVLQREIMNFIHTSPEWQSFQSALPADALVQLELGVHYMTNPSQLDDLVRTFEADRFIAEVYQNSLDEIGYTDLERITAANSVGLRNLQSGLRLILNLAPEEQADLESYLESKIIQLQNNGLTPELIAELQNQLYDYGIEITLGNDGYYYYSHTNQEGTTTPYPFGLFIDPTLPQVRQHELARTFTTDPSRMFGLSGIAENLVAADIREVIEDINNGGVLVTIGNMAYMVINEAITSIGLATMVMHGITGFFDDEDWEVDVHQVVSDWGEGLVPMMAIGLPAAFLTSGTGGNGVRGYFSNVLIKIGKTALYPVTIAKIKFSLIRAAFNESYRLRLGGEFLNSLQQRSFIGRWIESNITNSLYFNTSMGHLFSGTENTSRILACRELEALLKSRLGYSLRLRNNFVADNFQERLRQLIVTSDLGVTLTDEEIIRMNRTSAVNLLQRVSGRYTALLQLTYPDGFARPIIDRVGSTARWLTSSGGSLSHRAGRGAALYTAAAGAAAAITYSMSNDDGSNVRTADQMTTDDRLLALETLSDAPQSTDQASGELDSLRTNIEAEQADLPEYLLQIETASRPYREVRDFLAPNNLSNLSEDQAFIRVNDLGNMHMLQTEQLLQVVTEHKADLISYLQSQSNPDDPDYEPAMYLAEGSFIIKLNSENPGDLLVEYSSKDAFIESLWSNFDARIAIDQASEGQPNNPIIRLTELQNSTRNSLTSIINDQTLSDQAKDQMIQNLLNSYLAEEEEIQVDLRNLQSFIASGGVALDILMFTGQARDLQRVSRSMGRGNFWNAGVSAGLYLGSTALDLASFGSGGTAARIAAAAARLAPMFEGVFKVGRSIRAALAVSRNGRGAIAASRFLFNIAGRAAVRPEAYLIGLTGMDIFRTLYIAPSIDEEQTI